MTERTAEVPVPIPEVRIARNMTPEAAGASTGKSLEWILHDFGLPYELEEFEFSQQRNLVTRTLLDIVRREGIYVEGPSDARYATRALITTEAQYATEPSEITFLIKALHQAQQVAPQMRPLFAYATPLSVNKILMTNEAKAAELLNIMLADRGDFDGWSPVIDWSALSKLGFESAGTPLATTSDGVSYKLPLFPEQAVTEYKDKPVQGECERPMVLMDADTKLFFGSHNTDIATMQRWADWFAGYPVALKLQRQLSVIQDAVELAPSDSAGYWGDYQQPNLPEDVNRTDLNIID